MWKLFDIYRVFLITGVQEHFTSKRVPPPPPPECIVTSVSFQIMCSTENVHVCSSGKHIDRQYCYMYQNSCWYSRVAYAINFATVKRSFFYLLIGSTASTPFMNNDMLSVKECFRRN